MKNLISDPFEWTEVDFLTPPQSAKSQVYYVWMNGLITQDENAISAALKNLGKEDYNFKTANIFDGTDWAQRKSGQPFFTQVQIFYPHLPFVHDPDNPVNRIISTCQLVIPIILCFGPIGPCTSIVSSNAIK